MMPTQLEITWHSMTNTQACMSVIVGYWESIRVTAPAGLGLQVATYCMVESAGQEPQHILQAHTKWLAPHMDTSSRKS